MAAKLPQLEAIFSRLCQTVSEFEFSAPVSHVYNPLTYARAPFRRYLERYVAGPDGRTFLLGMNPGPWGMTQTGVPFGEVAAVRDWLEICEPVEQPPTLHPARPIQGFDCQRSEVSGRRLWGLFEDRFTSAQEFAREFVVINYCPLVFMEGSGRNRTPDKLPKSQREPLYAACDQALAELLEALEPRRAIGVGRFALERLEAVVSTQALEIPLTSILHPSPASPKANAGWAEQVWPVLQNAG